MDTLDLESRVAEPLLGFLREEFGECVYAHSPVVLVPGNETAIYAFRLEGLAPPLDRELVVRRFRPGTDVREVAAEAALQNALADQGFPASPAYSVCTDASVLGGAFFVMERLAGEPLFGQSIQLDGSGSPRVNLAAVVHDGIAMLTKIPDTLADVDLRIHSLDVTKLVETLERAGVSSHRMTLDARLEQLSARVEQFALTGLVEGVAWLRGRLPACEPEERVVCHGDMQPLNLLVQDGEVSGVVDWSNALLAPAECEIGWTRGTFLTLPIPLPGPLRFGARRFGRFIADRYTKAYRRERALDLDAVRYYEAFHSLLVLSHIGEEITRGRVFRDAWNTPEGIENLIDHFRSISNETLEIPPLPGRSRMEPT
jgi:aminoglycoside phosphotransferase (APT) family kinase protein